MAAPLVSAYAPNSDGISFNCTDCVDCTNAINDGSRDVIYLNQSVSNQAGFCIFDPAGFENKTFDCMGNTMGGDDNTDLDAAIGIVNKSNNTITNCKFSDFGAGIYLATGIQDTVVAWNEFSGLDTGIAIASGNVIYWTEAPCYDIIISNNTFSNSADGVYMDSNRTLLYNNTIYNTTRSGINVSRSGNSQFVSNSIYDNNVGISLIGDLDEYSYNNTLQYNNMTNNTVGLWMEEMGENLVADNWFISNREYGLYYLAGFYGVNSNEFNNSILRNTFIDTGIDYTKRLGYYNFSEIFEDNVLLLNNSELTFDSIYPYNINLTEMSDFTFQVRDPRPVAVTLIREDNRLFMDNPTRQGMYSFMLDITDNHNNLISSNYDYYIGSSRSEVIRYNVSGEEPSHGQLEVLGAPDPPDLGTLNFTSVATEEILSCQNWIVVFVDNITSLPVTPFYYKDRHTYDSFIVKDINSSFLYWPDVPTVYLNASFGVQWDGDYNDRSKRDVIIPSTNAAYVLTEAFLPVNMLIPSPENFYNFSIKWGAWEDSTVRPYINNSPLQPAWVEFTLVTYDALLFNITDITATETLDIISMTRDPDEILLELDGEGIGNITIDVLDDLDYVVYYDDDLCTETPSCNFTKAGTLYTIIFTLGSEHDILLQVMEEEEEEEDESHRKTSGYVLVAPDASAIGCIGDLECLAAEYCLNGVCTPISCPCGYIINHTCIQYECCADSDCLAGQTCVDHTCVEKLEEPQEPQERPDSPSSIQEPEIEEPLPAPEPEVLADWNWLYMLFAALFMVGIVILVIRKTTYSSKLDRR